MSAFKKREIKNCFVSEEKMHNLIKMFLFKVYVFQAFCIQTKQNHKFKINRTHTHFIYGVE
jgi:hypothetical protein